MASASEDFREAYGVAPILGRSFRIEDTRLRGAGRRVFWETQFGGDPAVLGRIIRIQTLPVTIVGVLPFGFYNHTAVWQASQWAAAWLDLRGSGTPVIARLRPGVTPEEASRLTTTVTALVAAWIPSRRALRIDPVSALRAE